MSTRFEILKNGQRVCMSGINGDGVLSVGVTYVKHSDRNQKYDLMIGGLGKFDGSQDHQQHASWPAPKINPGDEITIQILPPGDFDAPVGMTRSPQNSIEDPDFGTLHYSIDSWDGEINFNNPPIETAHLHFRSDDSGPSAKQRHLIFELQRRHAQLWSDICAALARCHPDIESTDELVRRIVPHIGINLYDESNTIELCYRVEGDPEFRGYFVTLRNWEIAEVFMAE